MYYTGQVSWAFKASTVVVSSIDIHAAGRFDYTKPKMKLGVTERFWDPLHSY